MVAIAKHLMPGHKISLQHRAHFNATRDSWTGLLNQITFDERIEQEIKLSERYNKTFALLVIDINHFSDVSSSCFTLESKNAFIEFSKRLKSCIRCTDVLARSEQNLYFILLPDIRSHRSAVNVVDNIYNSLFKPIVIKDKEHVLNPAIGIGIYPTDSEHREGLVQCAFDARDSITECALRSYRFYANEVNDSVELQLLSETTIRKAIDQGEYDISFEPVSRIGSTEVAFYNAEVAWRNSLLASSCHRYLEGEIDDMALSPLFNEMMLAKICRQFRQWQDQPLFRSIPVLMQVTPLQFGDANLALRLRKIAESESVATQNIGIIINERNVLQGVGKAIKQIKRLKKEGFMVVVDEFSQGLSFIGLLKKELVDLIRIDKALVEQVDSHIESLSVIEGIVRVAANLQINTIIPGVDTGYQQKTFLNISGNYWQGDATQPSMEEETLAAM